MKTQKQNEPQLSPKLEKCFREQFTYGGITGSVALDPSKFEYGLSDPRPFLRFLAIALEEQRAEILNEVENWLDIAPSMTLTNPANNNPANAFKLIDKADLRAKLAQMKGKE